MTIENLDSRDNAGAGARQVFPDQLRGLALLGIIVVNAPFFAIGADGYSPASVASRLDWFAAFAVTLLAQGKFYLIFSFLFGYSAHFFMRAGETTGRGRFRRRLIGLAIIGLAHGILLFVGDILLSYALLGAALMLMFRQRDHTVLRTSAIAALVSACWLGFLMLDVGSTDANVVADNPSLRALNDALANASWLQAAQARAQALPTVLVLVGTLQWGLAFAAFCLGLVAGRRRALTELAQRATLWRRLAWGGLLVGAPLQAWAAWLSLSGGAAMGSTAANFIGVAVGFLTAPVLAAGYIGAAALVTMRFPWVLKPVQTAGRATLTLYILESLVLSLIFGGYGFGLFGQLDAAAVTSVAIAVWLALEAMMHLWFRRFRQGPLESILGRFTGTGS